MANAQENRKLRRYLHCESDAPNVLEARLTEIYMKTDSDDRTGFKPGVHGSTQEVGLMFAALSAAQFKAGDSYVSAGPNDAEFCLDDVLGILRPVLQENTLSLYQCVDGDSLVSVLGHSSGAMIVALAPLTFYGNDVTLARYACTCSIFGLRQPANAVSKPAIPDMIAANSKMVSFEPALATPAPLTTAATKSGPQRIEDLDTIGRNSAQAKVKKMTTEKELNDATNFATAKYTGEALKAVRQFIDDRRSELVRPLAAAIT